MTSKPDGATPLTALQLPTDPEDFAGNVKRLADAVAQTKPGSIVVTPEVFVTGYPYDRMEEAAAVAQLAIDRIGPLSADRTVTLTLIVKERGEYVNRTFVFDDGRLVHEQDKIRLFLLGDEHKYFRAGDEKKMRPFKARGCQLGLMVCFELRYTEFWLKLRGVEAILVPARWGLPRKKHLELLPAALAVCNQCYVAVANSSDAEMASSSGIYDPMGEGIRDDGATAVSGYLDPREIRKVRRYIRMGVFE